VAIDGWLALTTPEIVGEQYDDEPRGRLHFCGHSAKESSYPNRCRAILGALQFYPCPQRRSPTGSDSGCEMITNATASS
jgi:hypothetical protein